MERVKERERWGFRERERDMRTMWRRNDPNPFYALGSCQRINQIHGSEKIASQ